MGHLGESALKGWAHRMLLVSGLLALASQLIAPTYAQSEFHHPSQATEIVLAGTEHSREGYFQLMVEGLAESQQFVIEQSSSTDFATVDATYPPLGSFRQISLSGFDDGTYYFRARVEGNDGPVYSTTHQLTVQHYPLWQALSLFGLGACLFLALIVTLFRLHRRSQQVQSVNHSEATDG